MSEKKCKRNRNKRERERKEVIIAVKYQIPEKDLAALNSGRSITMEIDKNTEYIDFSMQLVDAPVKTETN